MWSVAAAALLGTVIAWVLHRSSYEADVATLCDAERRSGFELRQSMPALTRWLRDHLVTPDGNALYSALEDLPMADRSARLRREAAAVRLEACPLARAYDDLVADGEYRADIERLCSYVTFPDFAELDDGARARAIDHWIEVSAASMRTRGLAERLRRAETAADRAKVLREAADAVDVFTCDIAKLLESSSPPAAPPLP